MRTLYVTDRAEWRAWLTRHHTSESEIWLVYYKKASGRGRIPYDDAVEEALCFGWIDSIVRRIDEDKFAQKFTPRRAGSRWSELNKRRLRKLMRAGRMTAAGLATVDTRKLGAGSDKIPSFVKHALQPHAGAWKSFQRLSPSRRRAYIRLITDARKAETRERRVRQAIALLERNTGDVGDMPPFMKQALKANRKAWENFQNLAPSYRRHYVGWIMHARQDATRERRLRKAIALLEQNKKLGLV